MFNHSDFAGRAQCNAGSTVKLPIAAAVNAPRPHETAVQLHNLDSRICGVSHEHQLPQGVHSNAGRPLKLRVAAAFAAKSSHDAAVRLAHHDAVSGLVNEERLAVRSEGDASGKDSL